MATEVFTSDGELFDRLVVITDEAVYVANPEDEKLSGLHTALNAGAAVKSVVPDADEIAWSAISSVKANKFSDNLDIYHRQDSKTRMKNVAFKDAPARDVVLAALARRLGPRFKKQEVQYGVARAALAPLLTGAGLAAFTYIAVQAAIGIAEGEEAEIRGRSQGVKRMFVWAVELLGPTGVTIVGAFLVLGCIAWLVARVKQPPLMITLSPR